MKPLINPASQQQLAGFYRQLPQAILLTGQPGVGLATIAKSIAADTLVRLIEPRNKKGESDHQSGTISIEVIRDLYEQTRSKHTRRQVFILDDADRMSNGAAAAFLKLLEEPLPHTHFILTSHSPQLLLPTILSRLQAVTIQPLTPAQNKEYIDHLNIADTRTRTQLEYLAGGLPAELTRLTAEEAYFKERAEIMIDTRTFLTEPAYHRLLIVNKYHQNRSAALLLLDSALAVTKRTISSNPQPSLVGQLEKLLQIRQKIEANCNIRLQLMAFVVQ